LDELEALARRLNRERRARREAERLLEEKSKALFDAMTESNRLADELREAFGRQTRELLNAQRVAGIGTFIWDIDVGGVTWSDGVYGILGLDSNVGGLSVKQYLNAVLDEDRGRLQSEINRAVDAGLGLGSEHTTTHRIRRADGQVRWIRGVAEVSQTTASGRKSLIAAVQDITELKEADIQVKRVQEQLQKRLGQLEKTQQVLEAARAEAEKANLTKSRFIAMISHEIRTPINGLLGTLSLLQESELDASQKQLLEVALSSGETLRLLLNDVIDFSRLETDDIQLELSAFSIRRLAKQMVEFWQPQARITHNQLHLHVDPEVPEALWGDPARLGQVLNNLLSNAIKFTSNGSITIRVSSEQQFASENSKCGLNIQITDTGVGIAREDLPRLFKEFSQTGSADETQSRFYDSIGKGRGAGLGLAICRALLTRMGGKISVTSALGEGSTFLVRVPLDIAARAIGAEKVISELGPLTMKDGSRPRALVVEDVPANQLVARMILERFGCIVDIANDGVEAVETCRHRSYDFILMDVSMPRLDGVGATAQIRGLPDKLASSIPIIGLTAFALTDEWERFYEAGMNSVVCKPIQRKVLYDEIVSVLSSGAPTAKPPTTAEGQSNVNERTLGALIKGFSKEQINQVFEQVSDDLDEHRRRAIASARDDDLAELGRSCHAIKGLAASFGGEGLAELARQIEVFVLSEDGERAFATTLDFLGPATDSVLAAIDDYGVSLRAASDLG
jgi:PAS domain S-box-containing protein